MNKTKITIWGRDFELDVSMECYPGEIVLDSQKSALEVLLNANSGGRICNDEQQGKLSRRKNGQYFPVCDASEDFCSAR